MSEIIERAVEPKFASEVSIFYISLILIELLATKRLKLYKPLASFPYPWTYHATLA